MRVIILLANSPGLPRIPDYECMQVIQLLRRGILNCRGVDPQRLRQSAQRVAGLVRCRYSAQRGWMAIVTMPVDSGALQNEDLDVAVAAYLGRFTGMSRQHAASDLNVYVLWCRDRGLDPLTNRRGHLELYVRWLQETRRFKPSTVSRRVSVLAGFYRTAVIDGLMESSPAEHLRRPRVPPESPTLGLTHLQFEALLTAARTSANPFDFALICLLGLLGLRIFEACGVDVEDLREEHGHRVLRVLGKGGRVVLVPLPTDRGRHPLPRRRPPRPGRAPRHPTPLPIRPAGPRRSRRP